MKRLISLAALLIALLSLALAGPFEEAKEACKKGDYAAASKLYQKACTNNIASACSDLGAMYDRGQGLAQDHKKAA